MTEQELRCEIVEQLNILDPMLGCGASHKIADKWLDAAREIYGDGAPPIQETFNMFMADSLRRDKEMERNHE